MIKFKGELNQLAFVLQYEDIIYQSFISLDAIFCEAERISERKTIVSEEEAEKFSKLIKAVAGNTTSLIIGSLENVDNRIARLMEIVKSACQMDTLNNGQAQKCIFVADDIREKIGLLLYGFKSKKDVPDFLVPSFSLPSPTKKEKLLTKQNESIAQRLADSFRVVEHKQILNSFFPGESRPGESGVLEIF
ncbi:MAG TPA: hypothetical protein ENN58_03635 [bacterium]|nr:hypothetical protein [bacterium]